MDTSIRDAFIDGIHEAFSILMTDQIYLKLLDKEKTSVNIYGETKEKVYLPAVQLIGKIDFSTDFGEEDVEKMQEYITVTIPIKELIDKGIPYTPQNYEYLREGAISYKDVDYAVYDIRPRVNIQDTFMYYDFICEKPKVRV